ncbi:DUF2267 domain-containing protein [Streptomyces zingiberis]|uniref:DUF2267 domain-containing protein n=1 Tax=Streptomyces zingiberis TaxID=2053010 RepID=A0ABX1C136_9ACTN|nr:DUF2267 domain-containing protein [Streptomyces zingiberis]NJQ01672.1 DUF2267 domain-containing protein [Streptomyces zingiberis]
MSYGAFLDAVRERGGYTADEADAATRAVLAALGTRLTPDAAGRLAEQMPEPLADPVNDAEAAARDWGVRRFIAQVAGLTGQDEEGARVAAHAVLSALAGYLGREERDLLLSRLPVEYAVLFGHPEPAR